MAEIVELPGDGSDEERDPTLPLDQSDDDISDSDSDYDPNDFKENNNIVFLPQGDSDDEDNEFEWCEHLDCTGGAEVRQIIRKKLKCCTCRKKAQFSCIHTDCVKETNASCCRTVSHIFPHMAQNDHPVIVHHKLKVILCTRCNIRTSIRQFLRHSGVPTDFMIGDEIGPEPQELQALTGYVNFGNTCYMNAIFQLLGHCSSFSEFFTTFEPPNGWENCPATARSTVVQLSIDFRLMWSSIKLPYLSPWKIIYCIRSELPGFDSFQQQDATEFLRALLDIIDRELKLFAEYEQIQNGGDNVVINPLRETIVSDTFQGTLENQIECHTCGFQSRTYETFLDLSVPIIGEEDDFEDLFNVAPADPEIPEEPVAGNDGPDPGFLVHQRVRNKTSLSSCLDKFFQNSTLYGDNQYSCTKCNTHVDATKTTKALRLPEVILIQLKRFRHTMYGTRKIDKVVEFPVRSMDFGPWTTTQQPAEYDLIGFVVHEGHSVEFGHYVTYCRHEQDQMWYKFDDLSILRCDVTQVARQQPYILMYRRKDPNRAELRMRQPVESPFNFFDATRRFLEHCPAAWDIIQEVLEHDVANNPEEVKQMKATFKSSLDPDVLENFDNVFKRFNVMMAEIQDTINKRKTRPNNNPLSQDNSHEALNKLIFAMEKWFKTLTKKQWVQRQMNRIDQSAHNQNQPARNEKPKREKSGKKKK